jgi:hypothetical protein
MSSTSSPPSPSKWIVEGESEVPVKLPPTRVAIPGARFVSRHRLEINRLAGIADVEMEHVRPVVRLRAAVYDVPAVGGDGEVDVVIAFLGVDDVVARTTGDVVMAAGPAAFLRQRQRVVDDVLDRVVAGPFGSVTGRIVAGEGGRCALQCLEYRPAGAVGQQVQARGVGQGVGVEHVAEDDVAAGICLDHVAAGGVGERLALRQRADHLAHILRVNDVRGAVIA